MEAAAAEGVDMFEAEAMLGGDAGVGSGVGEANVRAGCYRNAG